MATIFSRKNKDGSLTWRVQIRRKGLKTFCTCFPSKKLAKEFVKENEIKYCLNSDDFDYDKLLAKRIREFFKE